MLGLIPPQKRASEPSYVLLSQGRVDAAATLDINLPGTYSTYMVLFSALSPATDSDEFLCRTSSDGGASFDSGAGNYKWTQAVYFDSTVSTGGSASATSIQLILNQRTNAGNDASGRVYIYNAKDTDFETKIAGIILDFSTPASTHLLHRHSGLRAAIGKVDAIQFLYSTGNIATANWYLYGIN